MSGALKTGFMPKAAFDKLHVRAASVFPTVKDLAVLYPHEPEIVMVTIHYNATVSYADYMEAEEFKELAAKTVDDSKEILKSLE